MPLFRTLKWDHVTHAVGQGVLLRDLQHNGISFVSTICLRHFCLSLTPNIDVPPCWRGNCPFFWQQLFSLYISLQNFTFLKPKRDCEDWKESPRDWCSSIFPGGDHLSNSTSGWASLWYIQSQFSWVSDIMDVFFRKIYYNTSKMISIWFQHCFSFFAFFWNIPNVPNEDWLG